MKEKRLLIVEDEVFVLKLLGTCLRQEGYAVNLAKTGAEMHEILATSEVDLILLDLTLPDEDGLALIRQVRTRSSVPIIVLTARTEHEDRLTALDLGADDYLTKPCDTDELLLRVRNLLARSGGNTASRGGSEVVAFDGWSLDISGGSLTDPDGGEVPLPLAEFKLLAALARASNRVLSRAFLLDAVSQNEDGASERMIDVLVSRLRRKLGDDPRNPRYIVTLPGRGYKFVSKP